VYKWLDKMKVENIYTITESDGKEISGVYKGLITDHPDWIDFIVIQEEDQASGTLIYLGDIVNIEKIFKMTFL
jgi:hypothetical protein